MKTDRGSSKSARTQIIPSGRPAAAIRARQLTAKCSRIKNTAIVLRSWCASPDRLHLLQVFLDVDGLDRRFSLLELPDADKRLP
jgi:hypothetical protein